MKSKSIPPPDPNSVTATSGPDVPLAKVVAPVVKCRITNSGDVGRHGREAGLEGVAEGATGARVARRKDDGHTTDSHGLEVVVEALAVACRGIAA